jgi:5'-nucleotidase
VRVLLTNDDGIGSEGLSALEEAVAPLCELWVVAPDREQSAASHAISLTRPLRLDRMGERRYAVDGTPTDCVYLAVNHLLKGQPADVVLSGINHGPNLADDVTYSGTVAGAMEGAILGVPCCVAISLVPEGPLDFSAAASFSRALLQAFGQTPPPTPLLLNVNVPSTAEPGLYAVTRLGRRGYASSVLEKLDPRGRKYYWIGGPQAQHADIPGSDCNAVVDEGIISVTPLHLDLTSERGMAAMAGLRLPGYESI